GYHSLQKNFETTNKEESRKPHLTVQEPTERKEHPDTGYQLVPPSRSSISRGNDIPQMQNPISAVADTIVSAADEVVEGLGDLITPTTQGDDYAETAWQRKLRNQANRKKKRGRGM
ncbi:MAG: mobilization protein, partial [Prevotella sp.]|nr:mobilization protein [Prevotella sp.]